MSEMVGQDKVAAEMPILIQSIQDKATQAEIEIEGLLGRFGAPSSTPPSEAEKVPVEGYMSQLRHIDSVLGRCVEHLADLKKLA